VGGGRVGGAGKGRCGGPKSDARVVRRGGKKQKVSWGRGAQQKTGSVEQRKKGDGGVSKAGVGIRDDKIFFGGKAKNKHK